MPSLRSLALAKAVREIGVQEEGGNNKGVRVESYLRAVDRWPGVPWCAAFVSWCFEEAAGFNLPFTSAGVEVIYNHGKKNDWIVSRPFKGDLVLFGEGFGDHIGFVEKVLGIGPVLVLQTVEGNTSSGEAGSQFNGDGVYRRRRIVKDKTVAFIRVPDLDIPISKKTKTKEVKDA